MENHSNINNQFIPYNLALDLKELGFNKKCFGFYDLSYKFRLAFTSDQNFYEQQKCSAPTFSQAIDFLYICSNKQIDIELKASDTYEERLRKITKGCEDLRNLQNNKSN